MNDAPGFLRYLERVQDGTLARQAVTEPAVLYRSSTPSTFRPGVHELYDIIVPGRLVIMANALKVGEEELVRPRFVVVLEFAHDVDLAMTYIHDFTD